MWVGSTERKPFQVRCLDVLDLFNVDYLVFAWVRRRVTEAECLEMGEIYACDVFYDLAVFISSWVGEEVPS